MSGQVVLNRLLQIFHVGMCLALDPLLAQRREKKRSTRFNQDAEVGVKCTW